MWCDDIIVRERCYAKGRKEKMVKKKKTTFTIPAICMLLLPEGHSPRTAWRDLSADCSQTEAASGAPAVTRSAQSSTAHKIALIIKYSSVNISSEGGSDIIGYNLDTPEYKNNFGTEYSDRVRILKNFPGQQRR